VQSVATGLEVSLQHHLPPHGSTVSELDRLKEQLVYLRFWLGIMVVTEITLVGWLISTPNTADPVLWSLAAVGVVLLSFGIFLLHRQIERRIEEVRRL
jgi:hypothetical protein